MGSTAKAVSYLRVSGKAQIEGDGFPRQRETIARYAKTWSSLSGLIVWRAT
jgi:hypothetical protein